MLDDISAKPGIIVIIPGEPSPQPAAPSTPSTAPPAATNTPAAPTPPAVPVAPPAVPVAPPTTSARPPAPIAPASPPPVGTSLADVIHAALASGVYLTPPAAGTPAATAVEEIAKQCKKPAADINQAMRSLNRPVTVAKLPIASVDKKEKGAAFALTAAPPPALPPALSCLASAPLPAIRIDLLVTAREFGPMDTQRVDLAAIAKVERDLNATFGDPARPWRLATVEELLAILQVLQVENLWGPDGGQFWTSNVLTDAKRIVVETKINQQTYLATLNMAEPARKATPIWVRSRN